MTASSIWSNGVNTASKSGSYICIARYALVSGPGIAMRLPLTSARVCGVRDTSLGPYLSPMEAPCGNNAYCSLMYA